MHSTYFCSEPWQWYGGGGVSKRRRCDDGRLWCTRVPKNPRPNSCGGDRAAGRRHRRRATVLLPTTARGRAARRCAEADFGRTYRESNRGCRRRYVAHSHRHVARCRAAPEAVAAMSPPPPSCAPRTALCCRRRYVAHRHRHVARCRCRRRQRLQPLCHRRGAPSCAPRTALCLLAAAVPC